MVAYLNKEFLPKEKVFISPDDRGFLFSDGLYEVIRSYNGKLFNAKAHIDRLEYGAKSLCFNTADFNYLIDISKELIKKNKLESGDALVYLQITRGSAPRTHFFPPSDTPLTIYATAKPFTAHSNQLENGVDIITNPDQRWARCDLKTVGILLNAMAQQKAIDLNAKEAIFIRDGFVMEGTHTNIFAVNNNEVITPPNSNYILGGITRMVVTELCKKLSIPVKYRPIHQNELNKTNEVFLSGTTVEITPVISVDGQPVGNGTPGLITGKLQDAFRNLTLQ